MGNGNITLKQAAIWCGGRVAPEHEAVSFRGANFDTRRLQKGELFVAIVGARNGHDFGENAIKQGAAAVLASQPLPKEIPAIYVENTVKALQALAKNWRESLCLKAVGITGSVGKTTTKEMVAAVLSTTLRTQFTAENFNNDLGLPVTVLGLTENCEAAVLEMGMNHFGEISLLSAIAQPDIALITNVGTMHIENLGSREGILQAKLEILEGLRPGGTAIFNGDNDMLGPVAQQYNALTFGLGEKNDIRGTDLKETEEGICFTALALGEEISVKLPVHGQHNVLNALAAIAVGRKLGVSAQAICAALANFKNTGMREKHYDFNGLHMIEDCYNAGPESMAAALKVLAAAGGRKIAVLGGMLELGDFAPLAHYQVGQRTAAAADLLFAYGANSGEYVRGAKDSGMDQAWHFDTHEALAEALQAVVLPGDTVLLKGSRGMKMELVLRLLEKDNGGKQYG